MTRRNRRRSSSRTSDVWSLYKTAEQRHHSNQHLNQDITLDDLDVSIRAMEERLSSDARQRRRSDSQRRMSDPSSAVSRLTDENAHLRADNQQLQLKVRQQQQRIDQLTRIIQAMNLDMGISRRSHSDLSRQSRGRGGEGRGGGSGGGGEKEQRVWPSPVRHSPIRPSSQSTASPLKNPQPARARQILRTAGIDSEVIETSTSVSHRGPRSNSTRQNGNTSYDISSSTTTDSSARKTKKGPVRVGEAGRAGSDKENGRRHQEQSSSSSDDVRRRNRSVGRRLFPETALERPDLRLDLNGSMRLQPSPPKNTSTPIRAAPPRQPVTRPPPKPRPQIVVQDAPNATRFFVESDLSTTAPSARQPVALDPKSLEYHLRLKRPRFVLRVEARQSAIREAAIQRHMIEKKRRHAAKALLEGRVSMSEVRGQLYLDPTAVRAFDEREMKKNTKRRVEGTNEFRHSVQRKAEKVDRAANQLIAHCFSQKTNAELHLRRSASTL